MIPTVTFILCLKFAALVSVITVVVKLTSSAYDGVERLIAKQLK